MYQNIYEKTFAYALDELNIPCEYLTQSGKTAIKRFDFLIKGPRKTFAIEVKGRLLHTARDLSDSSFQNWITVKDADSLMFINENCCPALLCFVYRLENPYYVIDDDCPTYLCENERFLFKIVRIGDYVRNARRRSKKWETLNIAANRFKEISFELDELLSEL
ncbi:MAG: HYExAFE family protein [Phycisphaerae bacterium]|jgi:hypothetical protein